MPASAALPPTPLGLESNARRLAAMPREEAELVIDAQVAAAIREWRVSDATFWQRLRFRSWMIRTAATHRAPRPDQG